MASAAGDLKDSGVEKLKDSIAELVAGISVIRRSGYNPKGISLKLGLSPSVGVKVEYINSPSNEEIDVVLQDAPNETVKLFLKTLKTVGAAQASMSTIQGLEANDFEVSLGLSPSVGLNFRIL